MSVAGRVIESVAQNDSGQYLTYAQYLTSQFLEPLGMTRSSIDISSTRAQVFLPFHEGARS